MHAPMPVRPRHVGPFRPLCPADLAHLPETLSLTVDLEDIEGGASGPGGVPRFVRATQSLLGFLAAREVRATFLVVGGVARSHPALVREIAAAGHEIGSHGDRHVPLGREERPTYASRMRDHRQALEDLVDRPVEGYRAPLFSLHPATAWATDALAQAGFRWSSSIVPARAFGAGWPQAPKAPFLWPSGLAELPCPVGRVGPFTLPFLGGMYLRYLPPWRLREAVRTMRGPLAWAYCHPYDLDVEAPFRRLPGLGWTASFFLWWNRAPMIRRLDLLLAGRRSVPLGVRLAEAGELPVFRPVMDGAGPLRTVAAAR